MNEIFLLFVVCLILFIALMVIFSENAVHSVFYLIYIFLLVSMLLLVFGLYIISMLFVIIYVGAIAVLFLFVVMMINLKLVEYEEDYIQYIPLGGVIVLCLYILFLLIIQDRIIFLEIENNLDYVLYLLYENDFINLGMVLFFNVILDFIISGIILLVGMLGAILLTLHHSLYTRRQEVYLQINRITKSLKKN